jgi:hypothetical protein
MRNSWLQRSWKFKITRLNRPSIDPEYFIPVNYEISKGPYSTKFNGCGMQDLRDVHNIDASWEMATLLAADLERHPHTPQKGSPPSSFTSSLYGPMRIKLSVREMSILCLFIRGLREGTDIEPLLSK